LKLALRPTIPARERYYANPRPARRGNAPLRQRGRLRGQCSAEGLPRRAVRLALGRACRRAWRGSSGRHGAGPDPGREREAVPAPNHASSSRCRSGDERPTAEAHCRVLPRECASRDRTLTPRSNGPTGLAWGGREVSPSLLSNLARLAREGGGRAVRCGQGLPEWPVGRPRACPQGAGACEQGGGTREASAPRSRGA
jgi:hypothetical protein